MNDTNKFYEWAIIGAGPAGITAVDQLLCAGISSNKILWVDPNFKVGDVGTKWQSVPTNTKVKLFTDYLYACHSVNFSGKEKQFELFSMPHESTCYLKDIAKPLQTITNQLLKQIEHCKDTVIELIQSDRCWNLILTNKLIYKAKKIILAIGSEPISLSHNFKKEIPLAEAMAGDCILQHCNKHSKVAVFGSSHSAILAIKNLIEVGVKEVINFYRSPIKYALPLEHFILYDNTGLKGSTAAWAREYIDGSLPKNLIRVFSNSENINHYLPFCDSVIYAVGFSKRQHPFIKGIPTIQHDPKTGIIAPGLFGCGIAFPELVRNPLGIEEYNVGIWKFYSYLKKSLPIWLRYGDI